MRSPRPGVSVGVYCVDPATGALGNASGTGGPAARVSYGATWYDLADRPTASEDVGTNGDVAWTRPSSPDASDATHLVTSTQYNAQGRAGIVIDPRGIQSETVYDALGETVKTIADYTNGTPTADTNQTTTYVYDGDGNETSMTAVMPAGQTSQTTGYVYGVSPATGSAISNNDLLYKTEYPDATTGLASSAASDDITNTYDALGEVTSTTDQNDTTHTFSMDALGRETADTVTLPTGNPANIDTTVMQHTIAYDNQGNGYLMTSLSATGTVVNQIEDVFNGLGQVTGEYQSTSGPVVLGTTPEVGYAYSDPSAGSLMVSMSYPNGRILHYGYDNNALDAAVGRVDYLADDDGSGNVGTHLVDYTYLGDSTIVQQGFGNGNTLTYLSGTAGDNVTGLDQFGRIDEQKYVNSSGQSTDDFQYGYDQDGDVLYKNNLLNSSESELYHANSSAAGDDNTAYDPLARLTAFARGTLSASGNNGSTLDTVSSPSDTQSWNLDAVGNQSSVTTNGAAVTNESNAKNELTANGSAALTYDPAGNTIVDENGNRYTFDAWNHIATVATSTGAPVTAYTYDAEERRITETPAGAPVTVHYYNGQQDIEDRAGGAAGATSQQVFGIDYVNDLVEQDTATAADAGGVLPTTDSGAYAADPSFNSTGTLVTSTAGSVTDSVTQPNGQLLTAALSGSNVIVSRFNPDGSLDSSFGTGGSVTIAESAASAFATVDLQSNGQIICACDNGGHIHVFRFNTDGSTDTSFGTSGVATLTFATSTVATFGLTIQPDGNILVSGFDSGTNGLYLARVTSDGAVDTTFGSSGYVNDPFGARPNGTAVAVQSDGKIVVCGDNITGIVVCRFNANGSLDTSFGTDGVASAPMSGSSFNGSWSIGIGPGGTIVVGGFSNRGSGVYDTVLVRFTSTGTLDSSFGSGGIVLGAASNGVIRSILVEPDGTIFAGGDNNAQTMLELWEYSSAGTLEQNLTSSAGTVTLGWSIAMGANGQIIVSGQSNGDAALAAFCPETLRLYGQHDANWNTTAVVDAHGNVLQRYVYGSYGTETALSPSWGTSAATYSNLNLYQGMRRDPVTGLYYTPNRDYDPATGTWREADPAGYVDGASRYEPTGDGPSDRIDPLGLDSVSFWNPPPVSFRTTIPLDMGKFAHKIIAESYEDEAGSAYKNSIPLSTIVEDEHGNSSALPADSRDLRPDILRRLDANAPPHDLYEIKSALDGPAVAAAQAATYEQPLNKACVNTVLGPAGNPAAQGNVETEFGDLTWSSPQAGVIIYQYSVPKPEPKPTRVPVPLIPLANPVPNIGDQIEIPQPASGGASPLELGGGGSSIYEGAPATEGTLAGFTETELAATELQTARIAALTAEVEADAAFADAFEAAVTIGEGITFLAE